MRAPAKPSVNHYAAWYNLAFDKRRNPAWPQTPPLPASTSVSAIVEIIAARKNFSAGP
ncbi:MAG TPA: hypothetical protein VME47_01125 [Acetobacteraceae bacterium]|nr:hypothetical protein [Acetobacteraceae bacterium]